MSQYQKDRRNATSCLFSSADVSYAKWLLLICILMLAGPARLAVAAPAYQEPPAAAAELLLPVLTPLASNGISLHTHTVDLALAPGEGLALPVTMHAVYRLNNDGKEPATISLRVPQAAGASLTISADDVPLAPEAQADGTSTVGVTVQPDQPVEVVLDYSGTITDRRLPQVRYPAADLDQWLGPVSMRMDIRPAASMSPASWLQAKPQDWAYAPPGVSPDPALQWLYDGDPPDAIVFQAIHPAVFQQIQAAEQAAVPGAAAAAFAQLGELYAGLAQAAVAEGNAGAGERFYAQAVAAYSDGIHQGESAGTPAQDVAGLHAGLAALYRGRVVAADGTSSPVYSELMTSEASAALQNLAADDARRAELERWQAEGLRLLLTDARRRGDVTCCVEPDRPTGKFECRRRCRRLSGRRAPGACRAAGVGAVGTWRPGGRARTWPATRSPILRCRRPASCARCSPRGRRQPPCPKQG